MAQRPTARFDLCLRAAAFVAFAVFAVAPAKARAQGGGQQQPYENLRYFSKDTPRDSLFTIMRGFTYALGVNCVYCHVEEPQPNGRPRMRPGLDDKIEKQKARFMLTMTDTLNRVTLAALPSRHEGVVVNCVTCHRGSPIPGTIETVLTDALDKFGPDSAIARYRKLRENMASGRFDFSEVPVTAVARSQLDKGKQDVAVALLLMNQEFNPASADIDFQLGDIYEKRGDKVKAIASFEAVLKKRPNDMRARQRLTQLGKPPA
jgi:tetratricopeptide (TPR) repeat protein